MTVKDLRLKYKGQTKGAPFGGQLQLHINDYNHQEVEAYIEYLEELYLVVKELKNKLIQLENEL